MNRATRQLRTLISLGSLILLCLMVLLIREARSPERDLPQWQLPAWEDLELIRLERQSAPEGDRVLELKQQNRQWRLASPERPAGQEELLPLRNLVDTLRPVDLLAEKGPYGRFGLNEGERITLILQAGDRMETFFVGSSSPSGNYSYVRRKDDPAVYAVRGNLPALLTRPASSFRERRILSFREEDVMALVFLRKGVQNTLVREGDAWRSGGQSPPDLRELDAFIRRLGRLKALSFITEDSREAVSSEGLLTLVVHTPQGSHRLTLLEQRENSYVAEAEGIGDPFRLSRFDGDFLLNLSGF